MFKRLLRLLRRYAQRVRAVYAVLELVAAVPIGAPRPLPTCTIADFIASNRTSCGWTAV